MKKYLFIVLTAAILASCQSKESYIKDFDAFIEDVKAECDEYTLEDWEKAEIAANPFGEDKVKKLLGVEKLYEQKGYEKRLLSRSVEDSATVTSVLIPWNSCGMTQATVLKVPTLEYLPYTFFNIISPLMSVLVAAVGYKIFRIHPEIQETEKAAE